MGEEPGALATDQDLACPTHSFGTSAVDPRSEPSAPRHLDPILGSGKVRPASIPSHVSISGGKRKVRHNVMHGNISLLPSVYETNSIMKHTPDKFSTRQFSGLLPWSLFQLAKDLLLLRICQGLTVIRKWEMSRCDRCCLWKSKHRRKFTSKQVLEERIVSFFALRKGRYHICYSKDCYTCHMIVGTEMKESRFRVGEEISGGNTSQASSFPEPSCWGQPCFSE